MAANNKPVSQIADLKQRKFLFTFLIFLLIVVLLWVMINLFTAQNTLKISAELKNLANPLTPSVDATILDTLEKKQIYLTTDLKKFDIYVIQEDENNKNLSRIVKKDSSQSAPTPSPSLPASSETQLLNLGTEISPASPSAESTISN